jgi:hypothetical protein
MTLGGCYIVYDIDPDILLFDIERFIFDIERKKGLRYRIRYHSTISNTYDGYRCDRTSISTILFLTFDIYDFLPSISSRVTFDIEHLRYRYTISNVKNVDIERAFDIEVFDIECYARYRTSDTRYRGAKVPDGPAWGEAEGGLGACPLGRAGPSPGRARCAVTVARARIVN